MQILNRLRYIYFPQTLMSFHFFKTHPPLSILIHRHVFLNTMLSFPRPIGLMILTANWLVWILVSSHYFVVKAWLRGKKRLKSIPSHKQLFDIMYLSQIHGVPPKYYYQYQLYLIPKKCWLDCVFTFQARQFHQAFTPSPNRSTHIHKLTNKVEFSKKIKQCKLNAISTESILNKNASLNACLFNKKNHFIKPINGSQSRNCYKSTYTRSTNTYVLIELLSNSELARGQDKIKKYLEKKISIEEFIVQPLEVNHPDIKKIIKTDELITIRLITAKSSNSYEACHAVVEIPIILDTKRYIGVCIDITTGLFKLRLDTQNILDKDVQNGVLQLYKNMENKIFPQWGSIIELACKAHQNFKSILTIGWDLALTNNGPILIEGNLNWAVLPHQLLPEKPLLQGPLAKIYQLAITK